MTKSPQEKLKNQQHKAMYNCFARAMPETTPTFSPTAADFRAWLEEHHKTTDQLWVGYYKKATGKPSVTWEDTVNEALCYGRIDGIRKSRDDESYVIRFTPRKPKSVCNWLRRPF